MAFYKANGGYYNGGSEVEEAEPMQQKEGGYYEYFGGDEVPTDEEDTDTDSDTTDEEGSEGPGTGMTGGYYGEYYGGKTMSSSGLGKGEKRTFKIEWSDLRHEKNHSSRYVSVDPISAAKKAGALLWRHADMQTNGTNVRKIQFIIRETTQSVPKNKRKSHKYDVMRSRLRPSKFITRNGTQIEYKWKYVVTPCMRPSKDSM